MLSHRQRVVNMSNVLASQYAVPEGEADRVSGPPPEKSQNIGFINNTGHDP